MKRVRFSQGVLLANVLATLFTVAQEPPPQPTTLAGVRTHLEQLVMHPRFGGAMWGVKIVSQQTGQVLFEHNAGKLFSPASNCKLYVVALALDKLGADYRIQTSLYSAKPPGPDGVLEGDLVVYGRGDPCITARLHEKNIFRALQPFAAALTNAGVKRISGDLVADTSYLNGPEFGSGWAWDDQQYYYGAELSALTINDNLLVANTRAGPAPGAPCVIQFDLPWEGLIVSNRTVTVSNGLARTVNFYRVPSRNLVYVTGQMPADDKGYAEDVPVHEPAALFGQLLRECLRRNGVALEGQVRVSNWLDRQAAPLDLKGLVELGRVESLPLRDLAKEIQKPSQNLYTDLLFAHLGETCRAPGTPGTRTSEELGVRELGRFLAEIGIPRVEYYFEEGSGLSRNNLTTPSATVALLRHMARHESAEIYRQALPVAGVDGTLRNRMKGSVAAGKVHAKTGSLRWAASLSGYVTSAAGEPLVFSLMLNRYRAPESAAPARAELDAIATLVAGLTEPVGGGR